MWPDQIVSSLAFNFTFGFGKKKRKNTHQIMFSLIFWWISQNFQEHVSHITKLYNLKSCFVIWKSLYSYLLQLQYFIMQWNLCSTVSECGFSLRALLQRFTQNVHKVFDNQRKMFFEWSNKTKISQSPLTADKITFCTLDQNWSNSVDANGMKLL